MGEGERLPKAASLVTAAQADAGPRVGLPAHRMIRRKEWSRIAGVLSLSPREVEVVQHIFDGEVESQIAYALGISPHTVHTYVKRIYAKLQVTDHRELILRIVQEHLKSLSPAEGT